MVCHPPKWEWIQGPVNRVPTQVYGAEDMSDLRNFEHRIESRNEGDVKTKNKNIREIEGEKIK